MSIKLETETASRTAAASTPEAASSSESAATAAVKRALEEPSFESDSKKSRNCTPIKTASLIRLCLDLGYVVPRLGICNGLARMAMQAMLLSREGIQSFNRRLQNLEELLQKNGRDLTEVSKCIQEDSEQGRKYRLEFLPFFDGIQLWQKPSPFPELFPSEISVIQDSDPVTECLYSLITPESLKERGGGVKVDEFSSVYSLDELRSHLHLLSQHLDTKKLSHPIVIKFNSFSHTVSLGYDPKTKKWLLLNLSLLIPSRLDCYGLSYFDLEEALTFLQSEFYSDTGQFILSSSIYSTGDDKVLAQESLREFKSSKEFQKQHEVTEERAKFSYSDLSSWLYIACRNKEEETVAKLLSKGAKVEIKSHSHHLTDLDISKNAIKFLKKVALLGEKKDLLSFVNYIQNLIDFISIRVEETPKEVLLEQLLQVRQFLDAYPELDVNLLPLASHDKLSQLHAAISIDIQAYVNQQALQYMENFKRSTKEERYFQTIVQAVAVGSLSMVKILESYGLNIKEFNLSNVKLFINAISLGYLDIVQLFIERGFPVTFLYEGFTPLQTAIDHNKPEMAECLIRAGASTDVPY